MAKYSSLLKKVDLFEKLATATNSKEFLKAIAQGFNPIENATVPYASGPGYAPDTDRFDQPYDKEEPSTTEKAYSGSYDPARTEELANKYVVAPKAPAKSMPSNKPSMTVAQKTDAVSQAAKAIGGYVNSPEFGSSKDVQDAVANLFLQSASLMGSHAIAKLPKTQDGKINGKQSLDMVNKLIQELSLQKTDVQTSTPDQVSFDNAKLSLLNSAKSAFQKLNALQVKLM